MALERDVRHCLDDHDEDSGIETASSHRLRHCPDDDGDALEYYPEGAASGAEDVPIVTAEYLRDLRVATNEIDFS